MVWFQLSNVEESKAELESRYESRLNQLQHLNESLDASQMIESREAELDKLRTKQVKRKWKIHARTILKRTVTFLPTVDSKQYRETLTFNS